MTVVPSTQAHSQLAGYDRAHFRDHHAAYETGADMEPASQPLYAQQANVPRFPVPPLADTAAMFLRSAQPHVTAEEFATTEKLMADLVKVGGLGEELQRRLVERKNEKSNTSWFNEWWNDVAYLTYRDSVVWNVTYYLQFRDEGRSAMLQPTRRAARFVHHSLGFRQKIVDGSLAPDMAKGNVPMSNTQWKFLFNACRMPAQGSDFVRSFAPDLHQHIAVACKNRFFVFDVVDRVTNAPLSVDAIQKQLDTVKAMASALGTDPSPVGILSSGNRDDWLAKRTILVQEPGNSDLLYLIESAIFVVCLDDISPTTRNETGKALIHSDGRNRFWDKAFQLVVFENGRMGYVGEHAMMDGLTTTRFVNETLSIMNAEPESNGSLDLTSSTVPSGPFAPGSSVPLPEPKRLSIVVSPASAVAIRQSENTFDAFVLTKDLDVFNFHGYGKNKIKTFKVSPDAYAQMAIQLAYRLTAGHCRGTYESTQTRSFLHGRTEVTRSVSMESEAFCDAMTGAKGIVPTIAERRELLRKAAVQHSSYIGKASKALGCDRHLLGMRLAMKDGEQHPFFNDVGYSRSGQWAISTSGLVGPHLNGWGFGEVMEGGIGIGYAVDTDNLRFTVSSGRGWSHIMTANLETALSEMEALFAQEETNKPRAKL